MSHPSTQATPPLVTIAISTIGPRVAGLTLPEPQAGVTFLILVQDPPEPFGLASRADVIYAPLSGRGLSRSRNTALERCRTPFLVFSDDDIDLNMTGIMKLTQHLAETPDLDLAVGWRERQGPLPRQHRLRWFNAGHVCAPEFMVRHASVTGKDISFDTDFGVGAQHPVGEDFIFVCDLLRAGLNGVCFPVVTGRHDSPSTGDIWSDPVMTAARKAMLSRCFGAYAPFVRTLYAVRKWRRLGGLRAALAFAFLR